MDGSLIATSRGKTFAYCEGSGAPVVMIHGVVSTADCWTYAIQALRDSYQVIAPDLPGHGRSDGGLVPYGLTFYVDWLVELLDAQRIQRIRLVGHSMGGAIAAAFAVRHPERIERLALVDALGLSSKLPWLGARNISASLPDFLMAMLTGRNDPYLLRSFQPWDFLDPWGKPRPVLDQMAALNQPRGAMVVWAGTRLLLADFLSKRKRAAFVERLERITAPTLVVWGRQDGILALENAREGVARLPNARFEIIEDCAHEPMLERPDEFIRIVRPFLERAG